MSTLNRRGVRESNPPHFRSRPTELAEHVGFEPTVSCSTGRRARPLRQCSVSPTVLDRIPQLSEREGDLRAPRPMVEPGFAVKDISTYNRSVAVRPAARFNVGDAVAQSRDRRGPGTALGFRSHRRPPWLGLRRGGHGPAGRGRNPGPGARAWSAAGSRTPCCRAGARRGSGRARRRGTRCRPHA